MQAYAQQIQYEKEQLDQQVRMQRVELSRRAEELERMRRYALSIVSSPVSMYMAGGFSVKLSRFFLALDGCVVAESRFVLKTNL